MHGVHRGPAEDNDAVEDEADAALPGARGIIQARAQRPADRRAAGPERQDDTDVAGAHGL